MEDMFSCVDWWGWFSIAQKIDIVFKLHLCEAIDAAGKKIKDSKGHEEKASSLSGPCHYKRYQWKISIDMIDWSIIFIW